MIDNVLFEARTAIALFLARDPAQYAATLPQIEAVCQAMAELEALLAHPCCGLDEERKEEAMSRHHPVKVSYRQKGTQLERRVVCQCGCLWERHDHGQACKPCRRCGCPGFRLPPREDMPFFGLDNVEETTLWP